MPTTLLLCEYPTLCGGERSMLATLDGVRRAGIRPLVAAPPKGPLSQALQKKGVEHIPFATAGPDGGRRSQGDLRNVLGRLIHRCHPDVLHANSLAMGRLSGPVAVEAGVPSLAHLRDIARLSRQAVADLNQHRRLLAVSHAVRSYHLAAGLDAEKTRVVYNGVDLDRFRPRAPTGYLHRQLGLPAAGRLAGTIGQICLRKGQDLLLEAAGKLAGALPDIHFLIVGQRNSGKQESVDFEARLRFASQQGSLAGRLHLLGERDDVDRLLCELAVLIHPARQEPLGRVLLEAGATGVPIVATAVGGTSEIFPPQAHSARLVEPGNSAALAHAVAELLGDPAQCQGLGRAARARAEAAFTLDQAIDALVAEYTAVLE